MRTIVELWRGELPLGRAFWLWGVLGGAAVGLSTTSVAVILLAAEAPARLGGGGPKIAALGEPSLGPWAVPAPLPWTSAARRRRMGLWST